MDIRANTALYIRAIDGRFSILHKVEEEEIDARFNSGSKMEFLSERFEIKIRMFLKIIFPRKWEEGGREHLAGKVEARVSDLLRDLLFNQTLQVSPVSLHLDTRNSIDTVPLECFSLPLTAQVFVSTLGNTTRN